MEVLWRAHYLLSLCLEVSISRFLCISVLQEASPVYCLFLDLVFLCVTCLSWLWIFMVVLLLA